jgi:SWI/SNF-related matrix-associated actin-dependent regulator of chromatin subfamily A3
LEKAVEIATQLYCYSEHDTGLSDKSRGRQRGKILQTWFLNAIIYGPIALEDTVGDFLSERRIYLQDPIGCNRDVLYRNPHILSPETEVIIMTGSLDSVPGNLEIERLEVGPGLLAKLIENEDPLSETDAPVGVTTALFR